MLDRVVHVGLRGSRGPTPRQGGAKFVLRKRMWVRGSHSRRYLANRPPSKLLHGHWQCSARKDTLASIRKESSCLAAGHPVHRSASTRASSAVLQVLPAAQPWKCGQFLAQNAANPCRRACESEPRFVPHRAGAVVSSRGALGGSRRSQEGGQRNRPVNFCVTGWSARWGHRKPRLNGIIRKLQPIRATHPVVHPYLPLAPSTERE